MEAEDVEANAARVRNRDEREIEDNQTNEGINEDGREVPTTREAVIEKLKEGRQVYKFLSFEWPTNDKMNF